jgi:beta-lactamase regulating signal transducer with metallopeptidase domain
MIGGLLLYGLIVGALLSGAAQLAERALRLSGRPARLVWAGALAATLAVPVWAVARATGVVTHGPVAATVSASAGSATDAPSRALPSLRLPAVPRGLDLPLVAIWLAVSGGLAGVTAVGLARIARERRRWPSERVHGHAVRISDRFGPAVVGLLRAEIVLPRWTLALQPADQQLVLAHEVEHRRAYDPALLTLGAAAVALTPLNPCVWWQARRLRAAVELDCDRRVLRRGAEPISYGRLLLSIGSRTGPGRTLALPVPALRETMGSILERRLRMITYERTRGWQGRASLAVAAAGALVALACETPTPTITDSKAAPLHAAMATPPTQPEDVVMAKPLLLVDGVETTEIELPGPPAARDWKTNPPRGEILIGGVDPSTIERIEVLRPGAAEQLFGPDGRNGVVQITTKAAAAFPGSELAALEPAPTPAPQEASTVWLREPPPGTVVLIDGQRGELDDVNPDHVERIEVFKREAARALEPDAETVIRITTKK